MLFCEVFGSVVVVNVVVFCKVFGFGCLVLRNFGFGFVVAIAVAIAVAIESVVKLCLLVVSKVCVVCVSVRCLG